MPRADLRPGEAEPAATPFPRPWAGTPRAGPRGSGSLPAVEEGGPAPWPGLPLPASLGPHVPARGPLSVRVGGLSGKNSGISPPGLPPHAASRDRPDLALVVFIWPPTPPGLVPALHGPLPVRVGGKAGEIPSFPPPGPAPRAAFRDWEPGSPSHPGRTIPRPWPGTPFPPGLVPALRGRRRSGGAGGPHAPGPGVTRPPCRPTPHQPQADPSRGAGEGARRKPAGLKPVPDRTHGGNMPLGSGIPKWRPWPRKGSGGRPMPRLRRAVLPRDPGTPHRSCFLGGRKSPLAGEVVANCDNPHGQRVCRSPGVLGNLSPCGFPLRSQIVISKARREKPGNGPPRKTAKT